MKDKIQHSLYRVAELTGFLLVTAVVATYW